MTKRLLTVVLLFTAASVLWIPADFALTESGAPDAPTHYMGREIARTMHYAGAEWLTRESREREESASLMLGQLGIEPGMRVCDLGCGNGYHTLPMARMAGEEGLVYAVDIQQEMLGMLMERAGAAGIETIRPVLGTQTDPKLPAGEIDLLLLVDTYHEFSHPEEMLAAIRASLSPEGRVALAEYRAEDPDVPIKPLHKMSKRQILKEWTANGFELAGQYDGLPWQHLMFFKKSDKEPQAGTEPSNP